MIIVENFKGQFLGRHIYQYKVFVFESEYPGELNVLPFVKVLDGESLFLVALDGVEVDFDALLLHEGLEGVLELLLALLEVLGYGVVAQGDIPLQLQAKVVASEKTL